MKYRVSLLLLLGMLSPLSAYAASAREIGRQLDRTPVKQIAFRDADVADVIEQLAVIAREADPPVNIVLANPDVQRPRINLELRNQSLRDILVLVCKIAKLEIQVQNGIVLIVEPQE
jgi:hypothetical protein